MQGMFSEYNGIIQEFKKRQEENLQTFGIIAKTGVKTLDILE